MDGAAYFQKASSGSVATVTPAEVSGSGQNVSGLGIAGFVRVGDAVVVFIGIVGDEGLLALQLGVAAYAYFGV